MLEQSKIWWASTTCSELLRNVSLSLLVSTSILKNYETELRALQTKMGAEEKKSLHREEKIKGLSSDKLQLAQEEARLNDLLKQQAEEKKQVKSGKLWMKLTAICWWSAIKEKLDDNNNNQT